MRVREGRTCWVVFTIMKGEVRRDTTAPARAPEKVTERRESSVR